MSLSALLILKSILGWSAVIFGVLAGWLYIKAALKNERDDKTRAWFTERWEGINKSPWPVLPERATSWLLNLRVFPSRLLNSLLSGKSWYGISLLLSVPVFLFIGSWIVWGIYIAILLIVTPVAIFLLLVLILGIIEGVSGTEKKRVRKMLGGLLALPIIGLGALTGVLWMLILLRINIYYSVLLMIIIGPFYWPLIFLMLVLLEFPLSITKAIENRTVPSIERLGETFCLGITAGFTITFLALLIGHITDPSAYVPRTFQMIISNIIFDGLTMVVMYGLLVRAIAKEGLFRLPGAIFFAIIAAAILACGSLYFGLVFTAETLNISEMLHILVAKSPDGSRFELSPYFWVMHTTFLPTLLYLLFILLCWIAKAFLIPLRWFLGKGKELNNPLNLTAAFCTFIAAVLFFLYKIVE